MPEYAFEPAYVGDQEIMQEVDIERAFADEFYEPDCFPVFIKEGFRLDEYPDGEQQQHPAAKLHIDKATNQSAFSEIGYLKRQNQDVEDSQNSHCGSMSEYLHKFVFIHSAAYPYKKEL